MTGRLTDATRLSDILRSIERLDEVLKGGYDSFATSWLIQSATIRELEIIGEASGHVSSQLRGKHPEVRWAEMRGFASFAKHEYWRVDPKLVWRAVTEMPDLKRKLTKVSLRKY